MGCPRQRIQACGCDLARTSDALTKHAVVDACQRGFHLREVLDRSVPQRQVALLVEDLAGRGRLRPVRHLVGDLDGLADLLRETSSLGREPSPECLGDLDVHPVTLRADGLVRTIRLYSHGVPFEEKGTMAVETDPVCGMDVDPATSELSLEHDGTTYWFCGKGCLLEFRDDPETFLAPDYVPSM